jgi:hypothetical protein
MAIDANPQYGAPMHPKRTEEQRQAIPMHRDNRGNVVPIQAILAMEASSATVASGVPPGIRIAQEAYWRDLPELLQLRRGDCQWVAYHGPQRVGFAASVAELYMECERRGIPTTEFYVDRLEPRVLPPWEEEVLEMHFTTDEPLPPSPSA